MNKSVEAPFRKNKRNLLETEYLNGKIVFITNMIAKDLQARKHRKKRINKKWLKRYGYEAVPGDTRVYAINNAIFIYDKKMFPEIEKAD